VTPLVSIIIPCYNAAPWLAQTLESALAQTWQHVEIIVIDDGSRDNSAAIARGFKSRGVHVVTQPNAGASAARNHGLRLARGEFLQFLDADDLITPQKISAQVTLLSTRPRESVGSCAWGRFTTDPATAAFVDHAVFRDFVPLDFLILAAETGAMMHPSVWLVPRSVADRAGPWDETLSLNDDGEYFSRVLLASAGIVFCADQTARSFYRSGLAGSLSRQRRAPARISQFRSLELIERHLLASDDSPRVRQAVAQQWRRFVHDFFPAPAELIARAEMRAAALDGREIGPPPMGPKTAALARLIGWRATWRLKYFLHR
jgi:glycosyltransferase involved in cell wall biosynthesis